MTRSEYNARMYAGQDMTGITIDEEDPVATMTNSVETSTTSLGDVDGTMETGNAVKKGSTTSTNKSGGKTSKSIWEFLNNATEWFTLNLYDPLITFKSFDLMDVNFLPYYVEQHISNDFYTKMFAQMYPDPQTVGTSTESALEKAWNSIGTSVGAAVGRVTNTVANQINSTINYATSLVSSLTFGLVNIGGNTTSGKNMSLQMVKKTVPYLRIHEIRVNDKLSRMSIFMNCLSKVFDAGKALGAAVGKKEIDMKQAADKVANGLEKGLDAVSMKLTGYSSAKDFLKNMTKKDEILCSRIGGLAYAFIRHACSGEFMTSYELPWFTNKQQMMKSIGSGGFESGSSSMFGKVLSFVNDLTGGNAIIDENVKWRAKGSYNQGDIQGSFYLFNDTLDRYKKNLELLMHLVPHSMPIRDGIMYRPPCCYDVTAVGNRRCYFCKGDFTVNKVGKIRLISGDALDGEAGSKFAADMTQISKLKENLVDSSYCSPDCVNDEIVAYVPDAFEVTYHFSPICSETFNTFVYYFLEEADNPNYAVIGSHENKVTVDFGKDINYLTDTLMDDFSNAFKEAMK